MWYHWVVRANTPLEPFKDFDCAKKAWDSFNKTFPERLSAILMPNHLHMILPYGSENRFGLKKVAGVLSAVSRSGGVSKGWQTIPTPTTIPDKYHLRRQLRYIALNPCRRGLCGDPLEWYWSTYREVMGATVHYTVDPSELAILLGESKKDFLIRFHAYVSGDPSVNIVGTSPLRKPSVEELRYYSLFEILSASAAALRVRKSCVSMKGHDLRSLFIHLAYKNGWKGKIQDIAEFCKVRPRAIYFALKLPSPKGIEAAELCLSDRRLRTFEGKFSTNQAKFALLPTPTSQKK